MNDFSHPGINLLRCGSITWMVLVFGMLQAPAQPQMEQINRGTIAIRQEDEKVFVGWRLLGTDPEDVSFNLYRSTGLQPVKLNDQPISNVTFHVDAAADLSRANTYFVRPVVDGKELAAGNCLDNPDQLFVGQVIYLPRQPVIAP